VGVAETNLAGAGITLGGAVAFADRQIALRTRVVHPQIFGLPWTAEAHLLYASARDYFGNRNVLVDEPGKPSEQDYAVLPYRRFGTWVGAGRDVGVSSQLFGHYRLESIDADVPAAASDLVGKDIAPIDFQVARGVSYLSSLRGTFVHDTRDEPYLTHQGVHLVAMMEGALAPLGSDYSFVKVQGRLSRWYSLPWEHVLRAELFAGAIFGTAPFYDKFYVGDLSDLLPDRAIDLAFDRRPAPNWFGTRIAESRYGEYAARVNVEYRVPVYRGTRSVFGVDVFGASGVYLLSREKEWRLPPRGYDGFRAIPVDLTFNLGVRADTSVGAFSFGISNFIGFLPMRGEAQP
jgi:outer membrane protein assembly factor BamA